MFSKSRSIFNVALLVVAGMLATLHPTIAEDAPSPDSVKPATQEEPETPNNAEETKKPEEGVEEEAQSEEKPDPTLEEEVAEEDIQPNHDFETAEIEIPEISYDLEALPFPTRRMHELILEATKTGKIENLRPYIGTGDNMTMLSLGGFDGDPIDFLKQETGDENGHEIMAILEEVLEAGYVHVDQGTEQELYVWPYFFAYPLEKLNDKQMVELFRIVTYGDFQDMKDFGGYIFYRVGITPTGRWSFFVAGD